MERAGIRMIELITRSPNRFGCISFGDGGPLAGVTERSNGPEWYLVIMIFSHNSLLSSVVLPIDFQRLFRSMSARRKMAHILKLLFGNLARLNKSILTPTSSALKLS